MTHADDDGLRRGGNHPGGPGGGDEDDGGGGWGGDEDDGAAGGRRGGEEGRWISVEGDEGRRVLRLGSLQKTRVPTGNKFDVEICVGSRRILIILSFV